MTNPEYPVQQPRRPYPGAMVRYQAGPVDMAGYSHPAIVQRVGYTTVKAFETIGEDAIPPGAVIGPLPFNLQANDPDYAKKMLDERGWIQICRLWVLFPTEPKYQDWVPHCNFPRAQCWNWPDANEDFPCWNCGHVPGLQFDTDGGYSSCPNCGAD